MSESETPRTDAQRRLATAFDQTGLVGMAAHAEELERELAAAKAEVEALRTDAERYRYLRDRVHADVLNGRGPGAGVWCSMENEMGTLVLVTGDDLDAEVDAARAELAKEQP